MDRQKLVMVVGGSRGIGRTVSALLAHSYSNVAILYRAVIRTIKDICDADAIAQQIADLSKSMGSLDAVVHSAGANSDWKTVRELSAADWRRVIDIDLNGFFNVMNPFR